MVKSIQTSEKNLPNIKTLTFGDLSWTDIVQPTKEATRYLAERYDFNPLDFEDALSPRQVSKIEEYPDYLFIVFHVSVYDKVARISSRKPWSAFVGSNFLVTIRPPEFKIAGELFRECETREDSLRQYLGQGSGYLLYQILDQSIDRYFRVLEKITSLMDSIEDNVFKEEVETATELSFLRRDIINQRQVMFPTRTLFAELEPKLKPFSKVDLTLYFGDLMDHINRVCNTLVEYAQVIEVFKDSDYLLSGYRANRTMRTIALLLAIAVPFLVVASIYVMIPGSLENGNFQAFAALLAVIVVLLSVTLYFLRRKHLI
jgi:magnesium transporter